MQRISRCFILLAGCVGLLAGTLAAAEKSSSIAPPLPDMAEDIPHLVKFIEEIGKGDLDAARASIQDRLSKSLQSQVAKGPFEPGYREKHEALFGPFREYPVNFESVEFIGYRPVSSASRDLVFLANGEAGPILFRFQIFRYQGQWKILGVGFDSAWKQTDWADDCQRFATPQIFELPLPR